MREIRDELARGVCVSPPGSTMSTSNNLNKFSPLRAPKTHPAGSKTCRIPVATEYIEKALHVITTASHMECLVVVSNLNEMFSVVAARIFQARCLSCQGAICVCGSMHVWSTKEKNCLVFCVTANRPNACSAKLTARCSGYLFRCCCSEGHVILQGCDSRWAEEHSKSRRLLLMLLLDVSSSPRKSKFCVPKF